MEKMVTTKLQNRGLAMSHINSCAWHSYSTKSLVPSLCKWHQGGHTTMVWTVMSIPSIFPPLKTTYSCKKHKKGRNSLFIHCASHRRKNNKPKSSFASAYV